MSEQGGLTGCATPQHGEKNKREAVRKEKGIKMTAKELNLAARTVFAEAATEGLDGQMAVAQTMYDQLYHNIIGADGSGYTAGVWTVAGAGRAAGHCNPRIDGRGAQLDH